MDRAVLNPARPIPFPFSPLSGAHSKRVRGEGVLQTQKTNRWCGIGEDEEGVPFSVSTVQIEVGRFAGHTGYRVSAQRVKNRRTIPLRERSHQACLLYT